MDMVIQVSIDDVLPM